MVFSLRILGRLCAPRGWRPLLAAFVGAIALSGCGQKGPLFLPSPPGVQPAVVAFPPSLTDESFPATLPALPASAAR